MKEVRVKNVVPIQKNGNPVSYRINLRCGHSRTEKVTPGYRHPKQGAMDSCRECS